MSASKGKRLNPLPGTLVKTKTKFDMQGNMYTWWLAGLFVERMYVTDAQAIITKQYIDHSNDKYRPQPETIYKTINIHPWAGDRPEDTAFWARKKLDSQNQ